MATVFVGIFRNIFLVLSLMAFHFIRHLFSCLSFRLFCLLLPLKAIKKQKFNAHTSHVSTLYERKKGKTHFFHRKTRNFLPFRLIAKCEKRENHKMLLNLWHFICTAIKFILFSISTFSFRIIETSLHSTPRVVSCLPKVNFSLFLRKYLDINIFSFRLISQFHRQSRNKKQFCAQRKVFTGKKRYHKMQKLQCKDFVCG